MRDDVANVRFERIDLLAQFSHTIHHLIAGSHEFVFHLTKNRVDLNMRSVNTSANRFYSTDIGSQTSDVVKICRQRRRIRTRTITISGC